MLKRLFDLIKQYCWGLGGILTFCFFTKSWGFCPDAPGVLIWGILIYIIVRYNVGGKIYTPAVLFLLVCPIGILVASPDPCFKSWLRYGNFALLFFAVSPMFNSDKTRMIRKQMISSLCVLSILTAVASFFCFFLGINYMRMFGAQDLMYSNAGLFGGLCNHSMTLGPIAAIGVVSTYYMYMHTKKKIYIVFMAMCFGSVFFSASRSTLMATVAGLALSTFYFSDKRTKSMRTMAGFVMLAALTFPLWQDATYLMMQKQDANIAMGSATSSRDSKYEYRFEEFKSSPIFGIGFCAIDPLVGDEYQESTGTIEPGTSWGAVLSMTGFVGFIFFCLIMWHAYTNMRSTHIMQRGLLLGLLFLFLVHFIAEGYVLSAGNEFCFICWLVVAACCENYSRETQKQIFIVDENFLSKS